MSGRLVGYDVGIDSAVDKFREDVSGIALEPY